MARKRSTPAPAPPAIRDDGAGPIIHRGGRVWGCACCSGELLAQCSCCAPPLCYCAGAIAARRASSARFAAEWLGVAEVGR